MQKCTEEKGATSNFPLEKVDSNEESEGGVAQPGKSDFQARTSTLHQNKLC